MITEPYIFISYAHADAARLDPIIEAMRAVGYRVWYDGDITAGSEWSQDIAEHLGGCAVCLGFVSAASAASENCCDELAFAKSRKKPVLLAFTEREVQLSGGLEMQTARYQRLFLEDYATPADFVAALDGVPLLADCREVPVPCEQLPAQEAPPEESPVPHRRKWLSVLLMTLPELLFALAMLLFIWKMGWLDTPAAPETSDVPTGMDARAEVLLTDTVLLDGKSYVLPTPLQTLLDDGWAMVQNAGTPTKSLGGQQTEITLLQKNKKQLVVYYYNPSGHRAEAADCMVIHLSGSTAEVGNLLFGEGINLKDLSVAQLTDTYGPPAAYAYDEEHGHAFFYGDTQTDAGITVWYAALTDAAPKTLRIRAACAPTDTETDPLPPAYLEGYTPPVSPGDRVDSGVFSLEGKLYRLGVPLSVLQADGWEPKESAPDHLMAGQKTSVWLLREGKELLVSLRNDGARQTALSNGYVCAVSVHGEETAAKLVLPGGLSIGTPELQADAALSGVAFLEENAEYSTYKTLGSAARALTVIIDKQAGAVCAIELQTDLPLY